MPGIKSAICHQKTHVNNTQHCSKYNWHLQFFSFSEQGTKPNNESFKPTNITVECSSCVVRCLASILNYFAQWLDGFCSYFAAKAQQFNNYFGCENIYKLLIFTHNDYRAGAGWPAAAHRPARARRAGRLLQQRPWVTHPAR